MALLVLVTLPLFPAVYLLYVRFNKTKFKAVKQKHPTGSPNFELYRALYSTRTLVFWSFLSVLFVINLLSNLYKNAHIQAPIWVSLLVYWSFLLPLGSYIWWLAANKNR